MNYEIQLLINKAEQGDPLAQYNLAEKYYDGEGVCQDTLQAVYWYKKAAAQGNLDAQYSLGWCYKNGEGVSTNFYLANEWLKKAAERGHAKAQNCLGHSYNDGEGVSKDIRMAMYWWEKAAQQGLEDAQASLGISYYLHDKNFSKAAYWLEKAIRQGNEQAIKAIELIKGDLEKQGEADFTKNEYSPAQNTNDRYYEGSDELKERVCKEMKVGSASGRNLAIYYDKYTRKWKAVDYWNNEYSLTEDVLGAEWGTTRYKCSNGKIYVLPTNNPDKEKIYFYFN